MNVLSGGIWCCLKCERDIGTKATLSDVKTAFRGPSGEIPPLTIWKCSLICFNFVVCNPSQSSPSLTILVPLWFIIMSLVFSYLSNFFSGFLQFKGNFFDGRNISPYRDVAPLNSENCILYLSSIISQFFGFIYCMVFEFIFYCVTKHTLYMRKSCPWLCQVTLTAEARQLAHSSCLVPRDGFPILLNGWLNFAKK